MFFIFLNSFDIYPEDNIIFAACDVIIIDNGEKFEYVQIFEVETIWNKDLLLGDLDELNLGLSFTFIVYTALHELF